MLHWLDSIYSIIIMFLLTWFHFQPRSPTYRRPSRHQNPNLSLNPRRASLRKSARRAASHGAAAFLILPSSGAWSRGTRWTTTGCSRSRRPGSPRTAPPTAPPPPASRRTNQTTPSSTTTPTPATATAVWTTANICGRRPSQTTTNTWRQTTVLSRGRRRKRRKVSDRTVCPQTRPSRVVRVRVMSWIVRAVWWILNKTLGIVFLALTDLESPKGDRSTKTKVRGKTSGIIKSSSSATSSAAAAAASVGAGAGAGPTGDAGAAISYSVSYFSWTVSSSEDETDAAETITITLDRMKLRNRRSSRERNEERSSRQQPPSSSTE